MNGECINIEIVVDDHSPFGLMSQEEAKIVKISRLLPGIRYIVRVFSKRDDSVKEVVYINGKQEYDLTRVMKDMKDFINQR